MDFATVQAVINDLPPTFKRETNAFLQFIDALTSELSLYTIAADGIGSQMTFANSEYGWLDLWGLLFGIARQSNEADSKYLNRIQYTLNTGNGTPMAIQNWIGVVYGIFVAVVENFPAFGYTITFPPIASTAQINAILAALSQVRPAGVPFIAYSQNIGTYLDTINYLDAGQVTGAYMGGGATAVALTIPTATNNSQVLFPQLFLTDPTLNPSLASAG